MTQRAPTEKDIRRLVLFLGGYPILGGAITLLGWVTGIQRLADWEASGITMKANAAVACCLAGAALIVQTIAPRRSATRMALSFVVFLLGAITLLEHLTGWNPGLDTLLFQEPPGARATAAPGRMGIPASTSFILLGTAIYCLGLNQRARKVAVCLGVTAAAIASMSLIGHLYGADVMFSIPRLTGIAVQTASMLLALALAVIACVPEHDPMRLTLHRGSAGMLIRRVAPMIIVVPLLLGWIRVWIQSRGWVDTAFGTAMRSVVEVVLFLILLRSAARAIYEHERALFENRELIKTTLQSIGDGVITTNPEGEVTYLNAIAEGMTGWTTQEAIGRPLPEVFKIINETTWEPVPDPATRALALGTSVSLEDRCLLVSKLGLVLPVDDTAAPIRDEDHQTRGCVLVFRDATSRRTAERQLRAHAQELELRVQERTAELQRSNEQLEAFVYSIAHDLRAPLRTMASFSQLLVEDHGTTLDVTGKDYLRRIREGAEFMDRLLLDLLAYGRTSQAEMKLEPVPMQKVFDTACSLLTSQIVETRASIEVQGTLPSVRANETTLAQCIANLLNNSMKFSRPGVAPRIVVSVEDLATASPPDRASGRAWVARPAMLRVWFCDNGIGIAPEHQERAFRLFERLHGEKYPGTGIGLCIVRKAVERMGGRVGLESVVGQGTKFWIELAKDE